MTNTFSVAISYKNTLGWIDYDASARKAEVHLGDDEGKKRVEDYLGTVHEIRVPHKTLMDFTNEIIDPAADEESPPGFRILYAYHRNTSRGDRKRRRIPPRENSCQLHIRACRHSAFHTAAQIAITKNTNTDAHQDYSSLVCQIFCPSNPLDCRSKTTGNQSQYITSAPD